MLVALYHGDHKKDGLMARLGYWSIRFGQLGEEYSQYTHCEVIFAGDRDQVRMGSASFRDGKQVRITDAKLNPDHWTIIDVPVDDPLVVEAWFVDHLEEPYSMIGAMSSASLLIRVILFVCDIEADELDQWCSRSLGLSFGLKGADNMSVSELAAALWNIRGTRDVTKEFFDPESVFPPTLTLTPLEFSAGGIAPQA